MILHSLSVWYGKFEDIFWSDEISVSLELKVIVCYIVFKCKPIIAELPSWKLRTVFYKARERKKTGATWALPWF